MSIHNLDMQMHSNKTSLKYNKYWQHGIALHFFPKIGIKWKEYHNYIVDDLLKPLDLEAHRAITCGGEFGEPTRTMTYKGTRKKLEKFDYKGLYQCSFYVLLPEAIKEKDVSQLVVDTEIRFGLSERWPIEELYQSQAYFLIEENTKPFELEYFNQVAQKLHELSGALYGYYFRYPLTSSPACHIMGTDGASITEEEYLRNIKWHRAHFDKENDLQNYLRDIYKVNYLSPYHLDMHLSDKNTTLGNWITSGPESERGSLKQLSNDFYYWYVPSEEMIQSIRQELTPSGIIICTF